MVGDSLVATVVGNAERFNVGSELANRVGALAGTFTGLLGLLGNDVGDGVLGNRLTGIPVGELAG
jgi:hypothetical protein